MIVGAIFFVPSLVSLALKWWIMGFGLLAITGFVWLQACVAWDDCRKTYCPNCKAKVRVWPWSL